MRKPKLKTLVQALAFHLAELLGMDEDNEETVKEYHRLTDEYENRIKDIMKNDWQKEKPTEGGWWFWKEREHSIKFSWSAFFIKPNDIADLACWESGEVVWFPKGGWWCKIENNGIGGKDDQP